MSEESSFLSAFQAEWAPPANLASPALTIKHVAAQVNKWLQDVGLDARPLQADLEAMRERVLEAQASLERDLASRTLEPELRGLLEASLQDYRELAYYLEEVQQGVAAGDPLRVKDDLLQLRGAARSLSDQQARIEAWMHAGVPRCPRCGGEDVTGPRGLCRTCGVELLYPDPSEAAGGSRTATLPREYQQVYHAYLAILRGDQGVSNLSGALEPLRALLQRSLRLAEQELPPAREALRETLIGIADGARRALTGLEQMAQAERSRRTRDLHLGWELLFGAAVELGDLTLDLGRASGMGKAASETSFPPILDGVYLQGDD